MKTSLKIADHPDWESDNSTFEGIKGQEVSVGVGTSQQHGGCNGCTSFITGNGSVPHRVWIIDVRGSSFRLCDECKKELAKRLGYEKRET